MLRNISMGLVLLIPGVLCSRAQRPVIAEPSPSAVLYLNQALDAMQANSIHRSSLDWPTLRRQAVAHAVGAQTPADTYVSIRFALQQLNDHHSFLQLSTPELQAKDKEARERRHDAPADTGPHEEWPPSPYIDRRSPSGKLDHVGEAAVGTLVVPEIDQSDDGAMHMYAEALQDAIAVLAKEHPAGWIVDLRGNLGGNMWPMLAGLGPLVSGEPLGAFVDADGRRERWFYAPDGAGVTSHDNKRQILCWTPSQTVRFETPPIVAVLMDRGTASSGEAVAIAFQGRSLSRSFGRRTHGQSTSNDGFPLSDGANLVLTTGLEEDRNGVVYLEGVMPDAELPKENAPATSNGSDPMIRAAAGWIESESQKRGQRRRP